MEKVILGVLALGGLAFLWTRIKGYFAQAKTAKLESELKPLKEKANELVIKSNVSRESFLERYRKYKSRE